VIVKSWVSFVGYYFIKANQDCGTGVGPSTSTSYGYW